MIAQWTTLTRNSWFISPSKYIENGELDIQKQGKTNRPLPHTTDYLTFKDKRYVYEHGYFYMTGGYNKTEQYLDDYTEKYFNDVLSKEERYIEWFDSVVGLISWLENIGVGKFNSFNMNNNFSKSALEGRTPPDDVWWNKGDVYDQMVTQKRIANTWNDDIIIYDNPYVKTYADRIDFDKYFWFFEEKNLHKYGGIIEWSIRNFDENQGFSIDFRPRISLHFPPKSGFFFHGNHFFSKLEQKIKNPFQHFFIYMLLYKHTNFQANPSSDG